MFLKICFSKCVNFFFYLAQNNLDSQPFEKYPKKSIPTFESNPVVQSVVENIYLEDNEYDDTIFNQEYLTTATTGIFINYFKLKNLYK